MHTVIVILAEPVQQQVFADEDLRRLQGFCKVHVRPDLIGKALEGETSPEDKLAAAINEAGADILITGWGAPPITARLMEDRKSVV
jgi:hypothetical protein